MTFGLLIEISGEAITFYRGTNVSYVTHRETIKDFMMRNLDLGTFNNQEYGENLFSAIENHLSEFYEKEMNGQFGTLSQNKNTIPLFFMLSADIRKGLANYINDGILSKGYKNAAIKGIDEYALDYLRNRIKQNIIIVITKYGGSLYCDIYDNNSGILAESFVIDGLKDDPRLSSAIQKIKEDIRKIRYDCSFLKEEDEEKIRSVAKGFLKGKQATLDRSIQLSDGNSYDFSLTKTFLSNQEVGNDTSEIYLAFKTKLENLHIGIDDCAIILANDEANEDYIKNIFTRDFTNIIGLNDDDFHKIRINIFNDIEQYSLPPQPVELKQEDKGDYVELTWGKPNKGIVEIYEKNESYSLNGKINLRDQDITGTKLETVGNSLKINKDFTGEKYYLPITVYEEEGIIGKQISIASVCKPSDVKFKQDDKKINVSWAWCNTANVIVEYRFDDKKWEQHTFLKEETPTSKTTIPILDGIKTLTIKVYSSFLKKDGEQLISDKKEVEYNLHKIKIEFSSIIVKSVFKKKYVINIKATDNLPCGLVLLIREGLQPIDCTNYRSNSDYTYIEIPQNEIIPNTVYNQSIKYDRKDKKKTLWFRLIPVDKSYSKQIIINNDIKEIK